MASSSLALVPMATRESAMTASWRTDEGITMDIEKFIVPEFVASTYDAIDNQLGIFHNRVRNVELMEEMG